MADLGWIGKEGTERMKFYAKSKDVLQFLHDIRKYISNRSDLEIVEQTSQIITEIGNNLMNENRSTLKDKEK